MTPSRSSTFLRRVLAVDAALTGATALMLVAGAPILENLFGLPTALLRWAGVTLIPYTAWLVSLLRKEALPRGAVWVVAACNALWAIDSIALLFTNWVDPTVLGIAFVVVQALVVGALAEAQYMGLRRWEVAPGQ